MKLVITADAQKLLELKSSENTTDQNGWNAVKTVLREKIIVLNVYIIKFKRLKIKELRTPLVNNPTQAKGRKL